MGNPHIPSPLLHPLAVVVIAVAVLGSSALPFAPADNHLLDCGAASPTTLDDHRVFLPDGSPPSHPSFALRSPLPTVPVADPNPSPSLPPLYRTARAFPAPASYRFRIRDVGATHLLRLHFRPFPSPSRDLSAARFHVVAGGSVLLSNFAVAGADPVVKEYIFRVDSDCLVVTLAPVDASSFAFVNAIEVFSAPADLVSDLARPEFGDGFRNLSLSRKALETMYRINVGGAKVTSFNDTLWRTWTPDDADFLVSGRSTSWTVAFSGRLKHPGGGPSREVAPDHVYITSRVANPNLTWAFHVSPGFQYLVRMHFCDIVSWALDELYFDIVINGNLAYEDFDISELTGHFLASPHYIDFVVSPDSVGVLSLGISSSRLSSPPKNIGLLNGLEIFKINNSVGSLDGELSVGAVLNSPSKGGFGVFLRSLVCGLVFMSLVVVAFMLVLRWRAETRKSMAWSPLPLDVAEDKLAHGIPFP